ncbi:BatA domain-containing protein [Lysobacter terrae]
MNLAFALPLGLAALAAVIVPLLIHLRRRSEQHRTAFAALRWLPARARPRTRLRFEEWPLLLVRILLLVVCALLLAQPLLFGGPQAKRWLVVVPGADTGAVPPADAFHGERRWLAPGFPELERREPARSQAVGSLLRELDAALPADTQVTVVVPALLDGADAVAPVLHRRVEWRVVANATPESPASVSQTNESTKRPPLIIRYATNDAAGLRYLRAAAIAWQATASPAGKASNDQVDVGATAQALPATDKPLVWLASDALPPALIDWVDKGGVVLVDAAAQVPMPSDTSVPLWQDAAGATLVRGWAHGRGRILQWTRALTPSALPQLLEADFPQRLWALFAPAAPLPTRVAAQDYAPRTGARAWPEQPRDLQPWLIVLIAALFVIERLLATARREAAPA